MSTLGWIKYIKSNYPYNDNISFRRAILVNSILIFTVFIFSFFSLYNFLILNHYIIASLDTFAAFVSMYALYLLRIHKKLKEASYLSTANLILFFILFVYTNGSSHFGLIWTIFLPIFAVIVHGRKLGLYFISFFYTIIFFMSYQGIGIWSNGEWILQDFLRLFFASMILVYVLYMQEVSLEEVDKKLTETRDREKAHIEQLKILSTTDSLTKLYNRHYFNENTPKLLSIAKRENLYFNFFIIDVDYFKRYNDTYGHQAGDEALIKISQCLKSSVKREGDFIFRLGGEEFAGITLSKTQKDAKHFIEHICIMIEALEIEHKNSDTSPYLTVSIGVHSEKATKESDIQYIYKKADEKLYKAKSSGKNRSC